MARIVTIVMVLTFVMAGLALAGYNTATSQLLGAFGLGNPATVTTSEGYLMMIAAVGTAIISVLIGLYTKQSSESFILGGFTSFLAGWLIGDMISLYGVINTVIPAELSSIKSVLWVFISAGITGTVISLAQWWRGNDI